MPSTFKFISSYGKGKQGRIAFHAVQAVTSSTKGDPFSLGVMLVRDTIILHGEDVQRFLDEYDAWADMPSLILEEDYEDEVSSV